MDAEWKGKRGEGLLVSDRESRQERREGWTFSSPLRWRGFPSSFEREEGGVVG